MHRTHPRTQPRTNQPCTHPTCGTAPCGWRHPRPEPRRTAPRTPATGPAAASRRPGCPGSWCAAHAPPPWTGLRLPAERGRSAAERGRAREFVCALVLTAGRACGLCLRWEQAPDGFVAEQGRARRDVESRSSMREWKAGAAGAPSRLVSARLYFAAASWNCRCPCSALPSFFSCRLALYRYCCWPESPAAAPACVAVAGGTSGRGALAPKEQQLYCACGWVPPPPSLPPCCAACSRRRTAPRHTALPYCLLCRCRLRTCMLCRQASGAHLAWHAAHGGRLLLRAHDVICTHARRLLPHARHVLGAHVAHHVHGLHESHAVST